jgi:hypothetical protein
MCRYESKRNPYCSHEQIPTFQSSLASFFLTTMWYCVFYSSNNLVAHMSVHVRVGKCRIAASITCTGKLLPSNT